MNTNVTLCGPMVTPNERGMTMENTKVNGTWNISGSMKADGESTESKKFTLKVKFDNVPLEQVVQKALEPTKIQWVNNVGRKNYETYKDNQMIDVDFKSPGRRPEIDPEVAVATKLATMTPEEQQEYFKGLLAKAKG